MAFNVKAVYGEDIDLGDGNTVAVQHVEITPQRGNGPTREVIDIRHNFNGRSTQKGIMLNTVEVVEQLIENLQLALEEGDFDPKPPAENNGNGNEPRRVVKKKRRSKASPVTSTTGRSRKASAKR